MAFLLFFQRFSLGGDKTTRDVSLDEIGAGEAILPAIKDFFFVQREGTTDGQNHGIMETHTSKLK